MGQPFMSLGTRLALRGKRDGFSKGDIAALSAMNMQPGSARVFGRTVRDVINLRGQRRSYRDRVHEVASLPATLVCWGDKDKIIPVEHGRAFARLHPGVRLIEFPDCGHYLHNQEPIAFARAVTTFLGDPMASPVTFAKPNLEPERGANPVRAA
jgi:pimeloyl-ACP methyl ester carboxylesterase